jgi:broad specificity phosphatase PhoE
MSRTTSNPMPLRLYFIRHGETEWSRSGQYTGRTDIPLTAHGEDEARKVGQRLRDIPFAHVLTSPLQRAQQTCALAALGPTPRIEPDLASWNSAAPETIDLAPNQDAGDTRPMKQRAIQQWENEGGEIPNENENHENPDQHR